MILARFGMMGVLVMIFNLACVSQILSPKAARSRSQGAGGSDLGGMYKEMGGAFTAGVTLPCCKR